MEKAKKKRIELIDIAKAITIFCVLLGHTAGNLDTPAYRLIMYSFHMPLFFALAGMSMKIKPLQTWKAWKAFLYKNVLSLLVPYFIWGMIYAQSSYDVALPHLFYGAWEGLGEMGTLTSLWFLPCFFVARIITEVVILLLSQCRVKRMELACGCCAIPLLILGLLIPHPEQGWFFCSDIAVPAAAFILLGVALRTCILIWAQERNWVLVLTFVVGCVMFYVGTFARLDSLGLCMMCKADYVNPFWFVWNAVAGSIVVLSISMLLGRISRESKVTFSVGAITFVGQHTMGIYLLHKQILSYLIMPFLNTQLTGVLPITIIAILGAIIILPISCGLCVVIEKFVPQLLGQFPRIESK